MAEQTLNVKDLAQEWSNTPPDFHHDIDIDKSEKNILKKDKQSARGKDEDDKSLSDLTMDFLQEHERRTQIRNLMIKDYTKVGDYVVYNIDVHIKERSWTVSRRYREFHHLHEQLVQVHGLAWELLPPKKIVGNLNANHLEKRRISLEKYLKTVIKVFGDLPRPLIRFLEVDQFDVHAVCQQLARDMYEIGDDLLAKQLIFKISPLQIHCINRRLQLPLPTCESNNPADDIGHLYSFIQQIPSVLIFPGSQKSFVGNHELNYDLSIFRSLKYLEIQCCELESLEGIESIQKHLNEVRVHKSIQLLKDFLIGSQYWEQGILMTVSGDGMDDEDQVSKRFPSWTECKRASFGYNDIKSIDYSITLLPKVECLDLSHNLLTEVQYLDQLMFLSDLNLSYNELRYLAEFSYKIPSVSCLNLAGNGIQSIEGLDRLYCLEKLNISNNRLKRVRDVLPLGNLPLLRKLRVQGNPFTETGNYRVRILGQFGVRASEFVLDGYPTSNREMSKVRDIIAAHNSYDIIDNESSSDPSTQQPTAITPVVKKDSTLVPTVVGGVNVKPTLSPRTKRKERIAQITNIAGKKDEKEERLSTLEVEDEAFRQKIEKLREHAGESWLTVYNEMADDVRQQPPSSPSIQKKKASRKVKTKDSPEKKFEQNKPPPITVGEQNRQKIPKFARPLSVEAIDLELSDDLRNETKMMINKNIPIYEETYLASVSKPDSAEQKEYLIAIDLDDNLLTKIDFETGTTIQNYLLDSVRGVIVDEEPDLISNIQFEAKTFEKNVKLCDVSHSLVQLRTRTLRDAAGLYLVLKGCSEGARKRTGSRILTPHDASNVLLDNPYKIANDSLMNFFQSFIRKANNANKNTDPASRNPLQQTNYENINIGHSFLKHVNANHDTPQNILLVLWVGCLPYLFPDEEIPVCLVVTSLNIFLFRIFHPADEEESGVNKSEQAGKLSSMASLQEAMHCFYSFPLKSLREVVVGLFDQGLRLEVNEEGPRGTFVILTRDANKTGQFLDILTSLVSVKTGKKEFGTEENSKQENEVNIVYPDESKINALKAQLQEQEISPISGRENVISYCIVYQIRQKQTRVDHYDDNTSFYLRSMILTNMRLFLCDEDYVHWPLPSYIHAAPFTPQWIVDDVNNVDCVIGVDVWEDSKQSMAGSYGLSLTFEGNTQNTPSSDLEGSSALVWKIIFKSLSEREQLVRSLASIWKNSFGQDLKVTKSNFRSPQDKSLLPLWKGHSKKPSGNIAIPSHQSIDNPEMFTNIDRARLNELFREKIAQGDDITVTGVQHVMCVGCKPYNYPDVELSVAVLLGKHNIYLICSSKDRKYILANAHFQDQDSSTSLYFSSVKIIDLHQVVVGLFDQCLRIETAFPEATFVLVTRDFDRTNDLIQRLSQVILAMPKQMNVIEGGADDAVSRKTVAEIFQLYKNENEDTNSSKYYPKSEFIHPNSNIKFVYPSDELLQKLRVKIHDFILLMDLFPANEDFGILLYALIFQTRDSVDLSYTLVISESFVCLINEDHVSYPLPLFAKELPDRTQYEISDVRLIASLVRVEFSDFHSGALTLIFNASAVNPTKYNDRFKMGSVEDDVCYVTDVNAIASNTEISVEIDEENLVKWEVKAYSYAEREKIFNLLSKMWSNIYSGKTLPVIRAKK